MPSSPFLYHSGLGVIFAVSFLALFGSILTLLASSISLWFYRRTVARLMAMPVGKADRRITQDTQPSRHLSHSQSDSRNFSADSIPKTIERPTPDILYRLIITEPRRLVLNYAVAGVLFALLMGLCSYLAFSQTQINTLRAAAHPLQFLYLFWLFIWPMVLTINMVGAYSRRIKWLMVLGYFIVLFTLGTLASLASTEMPYQMGNISLPAWSGETPIRLAGKWNLFNLAPTLLLIAFRYRHVRAVAPLVLSFMVVVGAGVLVMITAAFQYMDVSLAVIAFVSKTLDMDEKTTSIGYFLLLILVACLLFGVFGWRLISWIRNAYLHKTVSDQSLLIDAVWLIFVSFYAVMLAFAGPGWALSALVAFLIFKVSVNLGNKRHQARQDKCRYEPALLILRVFSLGKRSETLFEQVTRYWRHLGNVQLIAGSDLALSTVAPHQFLAFMSGKLSQFFIRDETVLEHSLAGSDTQRDHDGRFRINDHFCHADTWKSVLSRLVTSTDTVLMDLRSYSENNSGCDFEINELLNTVPLSCLVFVIDDTTDRELLKQTLENSCNELRSTSPNLGASASAIQPFEQKSSGHDNLQQLMRQLCAAAGQDNGHHQAGFVQQSRG